ncbi:MAG: DAK2 domain-containing protein [Ruminococcaceae bacterium]|nr:DAK2 domain-containing protein [Oscillospiraceae bacterium]
MATYELNGTLFADMVRGGAGNLRANAQVVNDLNVFPIPDGDTGDNMSLTMEGGDAALRGVASGSISYIAEKLAGGMLLGARGNSGVILSQLFAGIAKGLEGVESADAAALGRAFQSGVRQAYDAVMTPTEGTILTVAREATEYAVARITPESTLEDFFTDFIREMHDSLAHTPDLLPILKESGVIDSGGAGLVYVIEGMYKILRGEKVEQRAAAASADAAPAPDLSAFNADSEMQFGYCTEFLLQLQNSKVDAERFDVETVKEALCELGGESVVAFKTGTVIKVHVHTMFPGRVMERCQQYGEFLTLKIENMALQHSEARVENRFGAPAASKQEHKRFGVVAVATGEGIKETFLSLGADFIVEGGQTMNPSSEDFLQAFELVNADTVFVLPNNSNIVLTAKQAGELYKGADVRVLNSKTVGEGYAALTMLDFESEDADAIEEGLNDAMSGVVTGMVTRSVRDSHLGGMDIAKNDYIGFAGKQMLSDAATVSDAACGLLGALDMTDREVLIAICGKDANAADMDAVRRFVAEKYPATELFEIDGGQDIYPFIFVLE